LNGTDFVLDHIRETDMEALLDLERICFHHPWNRLSFYAELIAENAHHLAVKQCSPQREKILIAYHFFRVITDEMEIMRIAVAPEHRGQGIAAMLLSAGLREAVGFGASVSFLEVRSSNTAALALYKGQGFQQVGRRKGYYPENGGENREDALILMKHLKEGV